MTWWMHFAFGFVLGGLFVLGMTRSYVRTRLDWMIADNDRVIRNNQLILDKILAADKIRNHRNPAR